MANELFVDVPGMNGLYNQLVRASGDAGDTLGFVERHCDLEPAELGYLAQLMTPHRQVYAELTRAITEIRDLSQNAGTQVNRAQLDYSKADHEAAAALDRSYPGATDPIALRGARFSSPPSTDGRASFADVTEPTRFLQNPQYAIGIEMWTINPLADLISPSAWVRQASVTLFGRDPFDNWVRQFTGNWQAYVHCGIAIGQAGGVIGEIGKNMLSGARDVPQAWRGNAADGFQEFQFGLARSAFEIEGVCTEYKKLYDQAAEGVKRLSDAAAGGMTDLIDMLLIISGATAAGTATIETVFGPIAGYSVAALYSYMAYNLYEEISAFFGAADDLIKVIRGSVETLTSKIAATAIPDIQPYHHPAGY